MQYAVKGHFVYVWIVALCAAIALVPFAIVNAQTEEDSGVTVEVTTEQDVVVINETEENAASAQDDEILEEALLEESGDLEEITVAEEEVLDGVTVTEVKKAPSRFGMFWRGFRERVSLVTTFDPVKKAEKRLRFAEERINIAEKIAEESDAENVDARTQKVIERAHKMIAKVEEKKAEWLENPDERKNRLLKNVATHHAKRISALERIEDHIPEDKRERFQERIEKFHNAGKRFFADISDEKIPEGIKKHIQKHKKHVHEKVKIVKEFNEKKRALKERLKDGDELAKEELDALKERRHDYVKEKRELWKTDKKEVYKKIEEKRAEARERISSLKDLAKEGDEVAKKALEQLRKRHS